MFPVIARFAQEQRYKIVLAKAQNQYPDITLISEVDENLCYAIDVKTTYRTSLDKNNQMRVSGMTQEPTVLIDLFIPICYLINSISSGAPPLWIFRKLKLKLRREI